MLDLNKQSNYSPKIINTSNKIHKKINKENISVVENDTSKKLNDEVYN